MRLLVLPSIVELGQRLGAAYAVVVGPGTLAPASSGAFVGLEGGFAQSTSSQQYTIGHDLRIQPGHWICSLTGAMDVADQWSATSIFVEEWIYEPPAEVVPNAGDGADRVDFVKLNDSLDRLATLLEALQSGTATP